MPGLTISWDEFTGFILSALVAVVCGVIIGLERESKGKPAGVRTLVLICLGSSIYVKVSILLSGDHGDPARVAAQIVSGIGFLGAGAIIQKSESGYVAGLTTAASIWVTAAVGMVIGSGHYILALISVIIVVLALRFLMDLEGYLFYDSTIETKRIIFEPNFGKTRWTILGQLEENMIRPDEYTFMDESRATPCLEFKYTHKNRNHRAFLAQIATLPEILEMN
ncbi:MAG: MgtC/SapB family protein [Deltaproteobacteria bacterium]|nr:MgtC/SapB family protein [Deltaproteobacteria bacterium]